jgi:hypothetical protein
MWMLGSPQPVMGQELDTPVAASASLMPQVALLVKDFEECVGSDQGTATAAQLVNPFTNRVLANGAMKACRPYEYIMKVDRGAMKAPGAANYQSSMQHIDHMIANHLPRK